MCPATSSYSFMKNTYQKRFLLYIPYYIMEKRQKYQELLLFESKIIVLATNFRGVSGICRDMGAVSQQKRQKLSGK